MENRGNTNRRLGPLHTTGNAMATTAYNAYKRAEILPDPIGTIAQKLGGVVKPILHTMQNHCLAVFSYMDDQILYVENAVEYVFPPSSYIFNKIDTLVQVFETMPVRFDKAADKLPVVINQVPYLGRALAQFLLILSFMFNTLPDWGLLDGAKEKEIRIDTNSHDEIATNDRTRTGDKEMITSNSTAGSNDIVVEGEENEKEIKETYKEEEMNEKKEVTTGDKHSIRDGYKGEISQQQEEKQSDNNEIASVIEKDEKRKTKVIKEEQNPIEKLFSATGWFKSNK